MTGQINISQLGRLLNNLHRITGLKFALMDDKAYEVYTSNFMTEFCALIQDSPAGYQRCHGCDENKIDRLKPDGGMLTYRCHAGLIEAVTPVTENGRIVASVLFGQVLSQEDVAAQWDTTKRLCGWHHDGDALMRAFYKLKRMSQEDIEACAEIVLACVSEVRFEGLINASALTDFQRLALYIDQHFGERLTLDFLSRKLGIGKTKLCSLASREAGTTLTGMITNKRIAVAKGLLSNTARPVGQIAEDVGIPDSNYFAKVFRRAIGMTPVGYRAATQKPPGDGYPKDDRGGLMHSPFRPHGA